jgi:hypothetical protein
LVASAADPVVGQAPLADTVYEFERLRCNLGGEVSMLRLIRSRVTGRMTSLTLPSTHHFDYFKRRIAVKAQWDNKESFYDRDPTLRLFFELNVLSVGVTVTRASRLPTNS